jgi:lipoprotein-anchoring transpeptidase ErfK/SrfK
VSTQLHRLAFFALIASAATTADAIARQPSAPEEPSAIPPAVTLDRKQIRQSEASLSPGAVQTLLARANFSPGLIDGKLGRKTTIAIEHLQRARGLEVTGKLDAPTLAHLAQSDKLAQGGPWTRTYKLTQADLDLITGPIPEDWNERAALSVSGYADLTELLSERGWCSQEMVRTLNPNVAINELQAGDEVVIPDVPSKPLPKLARVEVDLAEKLVQGFDESGTQVMLMHCSIAAKMDKRPVGELKVKVIATDPEYTFDPKDWPEVQNVEKKLRIAPGPRNPVGLAWIGLDKPGYGLHGTVRPQDIGKTGSHGCFRLANWDAARLVRAVKVGMTVDVRE